MVVQKEVETLVPAGTAYPEMVSPELTRGRPAGTGGKMRRPSEITALR